MIPTIPAKTIVSGRLKNPWFGADYNMNIYKGCCHGCIYCDSRSDCYRVEDFDTVRAKENALGVIETDLRKKRRSGNPSKPALMGSGKGMILTGSMSDPYNPFERELELSRGALALIDRYGFGVAVHTKSPLVVRDIDLLSSITRHSPACVSLSITAADDNLCKKIEPNAAPASERFAALAALSGAGIPCGVLLMPVLPFITDGAENLLGIVRRAHDSGAKWISCFMGMTLRAGQREYYYAKLDALFPGQKQRYMARYGENYSCPAPEHDGMWRLFAADCKKLGLRTRMADIIPLIRGRYEENRLF